MINGSSFSLLEIKMNNEYDGFNNIVKDDYAHAGDSLEDGEIVEDCGEETFKDIDDYVLSESAATVSTNIQGMDRKKIMRKEIGDTELQETFDLNKVDVYDAGKLEDELIDQASKAIQAAEYESDDKQLENGRKRIAKMFQEADDSVKKGDLTPFELMIKKQEELATIRSKNNKASEKPRNEKQIQKFINFPGRRRIETNFKPNAKKRQQEEESNEDNEEKEDGQYSSDASSSEYYSNSEVEEEEEGELCSNVASTSRNSKKKSVRRKTIRMSKDDGDEEHFAQRIRNYQIQQQNLRINNIDEPFDDPIDFHELRDEYRISNFVWNKLYKYQKTGIRWLYELHSQCVGGILADEMGLGKTIQICAFLRSVAESQKQSRIFKFKGLGPSLIVCPATVLHQWVRELNAWFPLCKVAVLHSSGAHSGSKSALIKKMGEYRKNGSILITSYSTYMLEYKRILNINWHYVVLDEGHKIRNPNAKVTITMKELRTPHRVILSGSPLQNNLKELWSLIDFIYPGRLGSLKEFVEKFSIPITQGGYANATTIQVRTAYKCACVLRDAINPYLLRRMKKDVQMMLQLPEKTEQILFCDITSEQRKFYVEFIESKACQDAATGSQMPFAALMFLRKLCNHPDLATGGPNKYGDLDLGEQPELEYGAYQRSGKMVVLQTLLRLWFKQGQKVLLFSQSRQMLTIIEKFILLEGYEYLRMDGTTPIGRRQDLVARFNEDKNIFIFLLTTRVGGLGVNLTGANRVVIFDPDWNPSTDAQARERAWRIGQNRAVTIYRLLTSGTIEEKIYQRQIFKHFLANRVLVNPKQQRFFKTNDLHELFTLGAAKNDKKHGTETAAIFSASTSEPTKVEKRKAKGKNKLSENIPKKEEVGLDESFEKIEEDEEREQINCELSEEAKEKLRKLAKKYAATFNQSTEVPIGKEGKKAAKNKRGGLFEGKYAVPMLKKQQMSKKGNDNEEEERIESSKEQDDYVLGKLLKKKSGGVHSALQHDHIVKNGSVADIQLVEDEADAVAKRAVEVLKRSRRVHKTFLENVSEFSSLAPKVSQNSIFGRKRAVEFVEMNKIGAEKKQRNDGEQEDKGKQFDGSSLLKTRNKAAASGADLLLSIRQRKEQQLDIGAEEHRNDTEIDEIQNYPSLSAQVRSGVAAFDDRYERMAEDIRNFLAVNNGQVSTDEILGHFKNKVQSQDSFVFRSTLKRLCKLLPNSQWILKEEFNA